jgi:acyl-CoA synthetase (AMP-forming)/AMP-acid ligase II
MSEAVSDWSAPPLLAAMQAGRAVAAERPAIAERGEDALRVISYGELAGHVEVAAAFLRERGVEAGDVVAVWLPNWAEAIVWEFALAGLGACALGVNTRYGVHELTNLLRRGRPVGILMPAEFLGIDLAGRLRQAWEIVAGEDGAGAPPWIAVARGGDGSKLDLGAGVFPAPALEAPGGPDAAADPDAPTPPGAPTSPGPDAALALHPTRLVNCFTTSGSSGDAKLAAHDQAAVARHSRNVVEAFAMDADSCFLAVLPWTGVFGFVPSMGVLAAGGCCLLEPLFDVPTVLADMQETGVTHVVGGDDMLARLMDGWDAGTMKATVTHGGIADFSGRAIEFLDWAEEAWGAKIAGVYGSSEIFALTAIWPTGREIAQRRLGGGAPVSADIEVRAADLESDATKPHGELGELQVRGYNVLDAYIGTPELLAAATTADGWFRTGDLGQTTGSGGDFVYVCRNSDALRLRGFLVEPEEIQAYLATHPAVETARVVGATAPSGSGDVAVGFVSLRDGAEADEAALLDYCRASLAPFKVPSAIVVLDEFPVTVGTNGTKIRTVELRRMAEERMEVGK